MLKYQGISDKKGFSMNKILKRRGFTLIELVLVISIGLAMSFISFQKFLEQQDTVSAKVAGEQIKQVGDSVNSYIAVHYDKLSALTNSDNTISDKGPRTCSTTTMSCSITVQTLVNEGLLPATYVDKNVFNSSYDIILKRNGTAPYFNINGLVATTTPWIGAKNSVRYDLLGQAMQTAGIDSGITNNNISKVSGYNGRWTQSVSDFSNINKAGQLAYQVGYGSYSYSIYLRRDGTLPMTGNLNMGTQDIVSAKNITASATVQSATLKSTGDTNVGGKLNVTNNTTLSGTLAVTGNTNLNSGLNVAGSSSVNGSSTVNGSSNLKGALTVAGVTTLNNTLNNNGVLNQNNVLNANSSLNVGGVTTLKNTANLNGALNVNGVTTLRSNASVAGALSVNGATTLNNSLRVNNVITSSGNITSSGVVQGAYLYPSATVTQGASCSVNGYIAKSNTGAIFSCQNYKWAGIGNGFFKSPKAQTIQCTAKGSYVNWTYMARMDADGQVYNRSYNDNGSDSGWKIGSASFVTYNGVNGTASTSSCGSGNHCTSGESACFTPWNWN